MTAQKNASSAFYQQPFASPQAAAALLQKYDPNFLPVGNSSSLYALSFPAQLQPASASHLLHPTAYPGPTSQLFNAFAPDPSSPAHVLQSYGPLIDQVSNPLKLDPFFDQSSWDPSTLIPESLIGDIHSNTSSLASFELSKPNRGRTSNASTFDTKASSNPGIPPQSSAVSSVVNYRSGTIERYNQSTGSSRGPSPLVLFGSQSNATPSLPLVSVPSDTSHISSVSSTPALPPIASTSFDTSRADLIPAGAASAARVTATSSALNHIPSGTSGFSSSSGTARGASPPNATFSSSSVSSSTTNNAINSNANGQQRASSASPQLPGAGSSGRWVPPSIVTRKSKNSSALPARASGSRDANEPREAKERDREREREASHSEVVSKRLRGILNKLTPGNFEKLYYDILSVGFASQVSIKELVSLIVEKALWEKKYCSLYAELCHRFAHQADIDAGDAQPQLPSHSHSARPANANANDDGDVDEEDAETRHKNAARNTYLAGLSKFHEQLLAKVQLEFESRNTLVVDASADLSGSSREEKERIRMLGIVKFLAELGKRGLVQETVLHLCIRELLQRPPAHSGPPTPSPSQASGNSAFSSDSSGPGGRTSSSTNANNYSNSGSNAITSTSTSTNTAQRVQTQQPSVSGKSNPKDKEQQSSTNSKAGRAGLHHHPEHKETKAASSAHNVKLSAVAAIEQPESNIPLSSEEMRLICNNIECVCNLLKLVGPMLDTAKAKNLMSQYMNRLGRLLKKYGPSLPSRVRFQLEDLLELRAKGWQFQTVGQVAAAEQNAALPLAAMQQLRGLYEWMEDKGSTSENSSEGASGAHDDLLGLDPFVEQSARTNGVYRSAPPASSSDRGMPGAARTAAANNNAAAVAAAPSGAQQKQPQQKQQHQSEKHNGSGGNASSKPEQTPIDAAPLSVDWVELDQMPTSSGSGHHLDSAPAHFDWASSTMSDQQRPVRSTEREPEQLHNNQPPAPPKLVVSKTPKPMPQVTPDALFLPAYCKVDYAAKAAAAAAANRSNRNPTRSVSTIPLKEPQVLKAPERPPSTGSTSNCSEASQSSAAAVGGPGDASSGDAGKKTKRLVLLHSTGPSGGDSARGAQFDAADMLTPAFARGRYVVPKANEGDAKTAKRAPPGTAWNKVGVQQQNATAGGQQQQQQPQQQHVAALSNGPSGSAAINSDALDAFLPQFASVSLTGGQPSRRANNRSSPRARE